MGVSAANFKAYAAARGLAAPALATDPVAEAALLRAQDYIQLEYISRFVAGCDENSPNVEPAIYEAALLELNDDGTLKAGSFWAATYTPSERKILTQVDTIKWEVSKHADQRAFPVSTRIEALLRSCLKAEPSGIGIWAIN